MNVIGTVTPHVTVVDRPTKTAPAAKGNSDLAQRKTTETGEPSQATFDGQPKTNQDLQEAQLLKTLIADDNTRLRTYHDKATGRSVLEITDKTTGAIVSQYPSDELLRLYAAMREPFLDQTA